MNFSYTSKLESAHREDLKKDKLWNLCSKGNELLVYLKFNNLYYSTRNKNEIIINHHRLVMFKEKPSYIGKKCLSKLPKNEKEEQNPIMYIQKKTKNIFNRKIVLFHDRVYGEIIFKVNMNSLLVIS